MSRRPEPSLSTLKTLFATSNNVCAFSDGERGEYCEQKLTDPAWKSVRARVCHIRGLLLGSARYDVAMTDDERNHFSNLILMCPNHHTLIDDLEPDRYSVDRLTGMKNQAESRAEIWCSQEEEHRYAVALEIVMRPIWYGLRNLRAARAREIVPGTLIDYEGEPVDIVAVDRRPDGHSVHLHFGENALKAPGWELDDNDPLIIRRFPVGYSTPQFD